MIRILRHSSLFLAGLILGLIISFFIGQDGLLQAVTTEVEPSSQEYYYSLGKKEKIKKDLGTIHQSIRWAINEINHGSIKAEDIIELIDELKDLKVKVMKKFPKPFSVGMKEWEIAFSEVDNDLYDAKRQAEQFPLALDLAQFKLEGAAHWANILLEYINK